jgi:hypothetical protein
MLLGPSTASAQTPGPNATAFAAYRTCLAKHGVRLPRRRFRRFPGPGDAPGSTPPSTGATVATDGQGGPGGPSGGPGGPGFTPPSLPKGVTLKQFQKARAACRSKLPKGFRGGPNGRFAQFRAYFSCLRDHGVKLRAPGQRGSGPPRFDPNDPAFAAANQICGALAPTATPSTTAAAT